MEEQDMHVVDLLKFYIGVEHYDEYDEEENLLECKSIELYMKKSEMYGGKGTYTTYLNADTLDEIIINQKGKCIAYNSDTRFIHDIKGIYSLYDAITLMIQSVKPVEDKIENGEESLNTFITIRDFMTTAIDNKTPAYMEYELYTQFFDNINNIYLLSYGNPLTQESKMECLKKFCKEARKNGQSKH